ncbi:MFS transporter [Candidatus Peregrinibacteria bacterium]|nr:MFS transporter [Candidatus Peregrinibacteria bacterium]
MQPSVKANIWKMQVLSFINWFFLIIPTLVIFYQAHGLSMKQVMIIQAVFSIGIVLIEIPSGYFADRFGRKASIIIGAAGGAIGMFFYIIAGGFWGFLTAEIILSISAGFYSGADSALIYDSLLEMKNEENYKRIQGRVSAIGNFAEGLASIIGGFLALISLKTPFYAEFAVLLFAIPLAISLREPRPHEAKITEDKKNMLGITKYALHFRKEIKWLILYSAVIGAATLNMVWFTQPYWENAGVPLAFFGILWALLLSAGVFFLCGFVSLIFMRRAAAGIISP